MLYNTNGLHQRTMFGVENLNWLRLIAIVIGSILIGIAVSPIAHAITTSYSTSTVLSNELTIIDANISCDKYDNYLQLGDIVQTYFFYCQNLNCQQKASQNFVYSVPCTKKIKIELTAQPDTNSSIVFIAKRYGDNTYPIKKIEFLKITQPETGTATIIQPKSNQLKIETAIGTLILAIGLISTLWLKRWWGIILLLTGIVIIAFTIW